MANVTDRNSSYQGPERRKYPRRLTAERRKEIRWEPNNPNWRQRGGRRGIDHLGVLDKR